MAVDKLVDDKTSSKYNDVIDDDTDDAVMIFLKSIHDKIDENITMSNKNEVPSGIDSISYSVDGKFSKLTISVTVSGTTKTAQLTLT